MKHINRFVEMRNEAYAQNIVDEILDKITSNGYGSLTSTEKQILNDEPIVYDNNDLSWYKPGLTYFSFAFYKNSTEEIETFKNELINMYPFILGFRKADTSTDAKYILLAYFNNKEECSKIKNDTTQTLYDKYVIDNDDKESYSL